MNEFAKLSIELQPIMTVIFAWNKRRSEHKKSSTECNPTQQIFQQHKMVSKGGNTFWRSIFNIFTGSDNEFWISTKKQISMNFSTDENKFFCLLYMQDIVHGFCFRI